MWRYQAGLPASPRRRARRAAVQSPLALASLVREA